ncbi:NAD(P)-dependent oxidoreductase [Rhodomicrobium sp.]|uniref:NAD(P)-dependent oxidoreductase n=1 Tax=Rhodomicrobium sp. TaxID=2720632 RepID=UPI0039E69420
MKIIVFGATGGTGRATVEKLLADGHQVTALVRDPSKLPADNALTVVKGDALSAEDVARVLPGHDVCVISLGNSRSTQGRKRTINPHICEYGTRNILAVAERGLRLIAVTAFGIGDTRDKKSFLFSIAAALFMRAILADKEKQEAAIKAAPNDFVLVQPVGLTNGPATGNYLASADRKARKMTISRADVADFIAKEIASPEHHRQTVALSG